MTSYLKQLDLIVGFRLCGFTQFHRCYDLLEYTGVALILGN